MERKLFGIFSGTHLTMLAMTAIIVPGALYGAVSYQSVAITDPGSGKQAYVDPGRRLYVYDQVAGYANFPGTLVDIYFGVASAGSACKSVYVIPTGKALVIREITGTFYVYANSGSSTSGTGSFTLNTTETCGGTLATYQQNLVAGTFQPMNVTLGVGAAVPAGLSLYGYTNNSYVIGSIHGYLVPASTVPASGTSAAAELNPAPTNPPKAPR